MGTLQPPTWLSDTDLGKPTPDREIRPDDFYDAVLAGLFDIHGKFWVDFHSLEYLGELCYALYEHLKERGDVELRFHRRADSDRYYDRQHLRRRIAYFATFGFIYHWTEHLVEPRSSTAAELVEHLYRLPVPFAEWRAWMVEFRRTPRT